MSKKVIIFIVLAAALMVLFSIGCKNEPDDYSISKVTIYNIPANIDVDDDSGDSNPTYKVYVNASNSMSDDDLASAYGFEILTSSMKQANGTYTVTIDLFKPASNSQKLPEFISDIPFFGTAKYFSIMLSPHYLHGKEEDAVWIKGSMDPLNKARQNINWESSFLLNFRNPLLAFLDFKAKTKTICEGSVLNDPDIINED